MTKPAGRCPNCGGPVVFQWSSAVQTVCAHCRSVVVRHDVDLQALGVASDLPPDSSPIQIGTLGRVDDSAFTVTGRIVYEYEDGGWSEWHLAFEGGQSAWLSDAQAEYALSRLTKMPDALPDERTITLGAWLYLGDVQLQVTTLTRARYKGVDGELPFEYFGKGDILFADLRGHHGVFGTIDYSESPPLLFTGRFVEYDDLALRNVRQFDGW